MKTHLPLFAVICLAGCIPKNYTISIPALEKIADAVTTATAPTCPNIDPTEITDPLAQQITSQEWTAIISSIATVATIIIHRYWYHRRNGVIRPK